MIFPVIDIASGETTVAAKEGTVPQDTAPLLEVRNPTTRFDIKSGLFGRRSGAVHAVEDVSFDLRRGETLSLVGESDCGKSTTGRSILRLVEPKAGTISLEGYDVMRLDRPALRAMRQSIQMIFLDPFASLNPRQTNGSAIMEPFVAHKLGSADPAHAKAADLLERVGLKADMMKRYPHEFSGGQRQCIAIARSLILDPKIIVADEAVPALDVAIKAQVCNLLLDLQKSFNLAHLFIFHDMAIVERASHRVTVIYLGEIVEIEPPRSIFENPQHPYTKKLMAAVPDPTRSRPDVTSGGRHRTMKSAAQFVR